jgi:hypothetical protein
MASFRFSGRRPRRTRHSRPVEEVGGEPALQEVLVGEDRLVERDVRGEAVDDELVERDPRPGDRRRTVGPPDDELAEE